MNSLSLLLWIPALGALVIAILPRAQAPWGRYIALLCSLGQCIIAAALLATLYLLSPKGLYPLSSFVWVSHAPWLRLPMGDGNMLAVDYLVGADGLNAPLIGMSALVLLIGLLASWQQNNRPRAYFSLYLVLSACIMGALCSLDALLFFVFFEFMLLPAYLLISIWGGKGREKAALHFLLYTFAGSLLVLLVILGLYLSVPPLHEHGLALRHVDLTRLVEVSYLQGMLAIHAASTFFGISLREWAFFLLLIGFGVKMPIVLLHTWLPRAHVAASTPISVLLAGILLKLGAYGFLRLGVLVFPDMLVKHALWVAVLGVSAILYGAFNALTERDLKRLIAYSSIAHMGFVLLGIASLNIEGLMGAMYQMVSHGLISTALFLLVAVIESRTHSRRIEHFSGLSTPMPYFSAYTVLFFFAAFGMPGFSGFLAELFVFMGVFEAAALGLLPGLMGALAVLSLLLLAGCFLWAFQRICLGPYWVKEGAWHATLTDLKPKEWLPLLVLAVLVVFLGIFPQPLLKGMHETLAHLQAQLHAHL